MLTGAIAAPAPDRPNVVIVYADDLGYGDLGCYGERRWQTPRLDAMAKQGMTFTDFYVAQAVCSASRAALLTGCYPNRVGIAGALGPNAKIGLHDSERTLGHVCRSRGYATSAVGKWHLGHLPPFLPTRRGFDEYLGLPYSNDMWPHHPEAKKGTYPNLPLIDGDKAIDPDVSPEDMAKLTGQYTDRAVSFIERNKAKPFFLYVAHSMPHVPLAVGADAKGKSGAGTYGDVIREIDSSVGRILDAIKANGLDEKTLVLFASDNGPWLSYGNHAGTAGPLREGKGTAWEGGVRVPCIARFPGVVPAGAVCREPMMTIDVLPTVAKLIGAELPKRKIDGLDCGPLLRGEPGAKSPHEALFFWYADNQLQAVRSGLWKLILPHTYRTMNGQAPGKDGVPGRYRQVKVNAAELYDLVSDSGETTDVSAKFPAEVNRLTALAEKVREDLGDTLTKKAGKNRRPAGKVEDAKPTFESSMVFPLDPQHNHAPGVVECPNDDILVSWYRGSGERTADDVVVLGSRKKRGEAAWSKPFEMADTPGFPDCNTTMYVDEKGKLYLFWPVIIANSWESCLTTVRTSTDYAGEGSPKWATNDTMYLKPVDFIPEMKKGWEDYTKAFGNALIKRIGEAELEKRINDKLLSRLGWQPRNKPIRHSSGRLLLPLYSDTYSAGLIAYSDDGGKTWLASKPMAAYGGIQPTLFEKKDGTVVAYLRENGPLGKIRVCESKDKGVSWGPVGVCDLPNPGSGCDGVRLANGHWLMVYNDLPRGRHRLAVSISTDEGKTWPVTKHLEDQADGRFHYPAVIQGRDGAIHCVYSLFLPAGKSMKYVKFDEAWVAGK
jgi:arylsulfatase A